MMKKEREFRDNFTMEDVEFKLKNFHGGPDDFNPDGGKRYALIYLDEATAEKLSSEGYGVKIENPENHENPRPYIRINVRYRTEEELETMRANGWRTKNPEIYTVSEGLNRRLLCTAKTVGDIDEDRVVKADITLSPSENRQRPGSWSLWIRKAYIFTEKAKKDELDRKYAYLMEDDDDDDEGVPFN